MTNPHAVHLLLAALALFASLSLRKWLPGHECDPIAVYAAAVGAMYARHHHRHKARPFRGHKQKQGNRT